MKSVISLPDTVMTGSVVIDPQLNLGPISRILTLRYDPLSKPVRPPLSPHDFTPKNSEGVQDTIVEITRRGLLSRQRELGFRRASLSLSAGIDSGLTLAMLRKFLPKVKLKCISVGFGDRDDETERAREIARTHNCDFTEMILDDVLASLPKLINIVKEPRWNLYQYYALEEGRRTSDVFYSGDGGDELFGGYTFRYAKFLSMVGDGWRDRTMNYLACHERDWVPDQEQMFGREIKFSWDEVYQVLRPNFDNNLPPLDQVFLADFNGKLLHDWLPTNRAFEKSLRIKIESIFLTDEIIQFATRVPWQLKYDPEMAVGKMPLRAILSLQQGFEGAQPVKKGFSADLASLWVRGAREVVDRYVNADSEVVKKGLVNAEWLIKSSGRLGQEPDLRYVSKMLSILALEVWHRLFVTGTMNAGQRL